jgi:hypothetical protein
MKPSCNSLPHTNILLLTRLSTRPMTERTNKTPAAVGQKERSDQGVRRFGCHRPTGFRENVPEFLLLERSHLPAISSNN